jgi:hypothetical protein
MPTGIQQLRRENSDGAVVGGKGFVQLGHLAADTGQLFHQMDLDAHLSQVQGGLNTGDPTADYHDLFAHCSPHAKCLKFSEMSKMSKVSKMPRFIKIQLNPHSAFRNPKSPI